MRTALAALLVLAAGCRTFRGSEDPVARDLEIARDVKWRLSKNAQFAEVLVACKDRVVTLTGRVTAVAIAVDAEKTAAQTREVARVVNKLEVRPK